MIRKEGYTLVEVLVVLGVVSILFSVGFANFRDFSRRQVLAGVVKQIQGDVRLAQQMSLSGLKPDDLGCSTENLNGISFGIEGNPGRFYKIQAVCGDDPTQSSYPTLKEVSLPSGITANISNMPVNPVIFKVLGQGTNVPAGAEVIIGLVQEGTGYSGKVTITPGGEIK